jgi:hypothetical protein
MALGEHASWFLSGVDNVRLMEDELLIGPLAKISDLSGRKGFDENFLGLSAPFPGSPAQRGTLRSRCCCRRRTSRC